MGDSPSTTARQWSDLVSEGLELVAALSRSQWAIGDLALEAEPIGSQGGRATGTLEHLDRFAEEIGMEHKTLQEWRHVAAKWPTDTRRLEMPWSLHQTLAGLEDRAEVIGSRDDWTIAAARDFVAERRRTAADDRGAESPGGGGGEPEIRSTWSRVDEVLRRHLSSDHQDMLRILRRELMPIIEGL